MSCFESMGDSIGLPMFFVNRQTDRGNNHNSDMNTLGQRIRTRRKTLKLTQKALASSVGMSQGNLSELENDVYPSSGFTPQLAKELKVSAYWLSTGKGQMDTGALTDAMPNQSISQIANMLKDASEAALKAAILAVRDIMSPPVREITEPTQKDYLPAANLIPIPFKTLGLPAPFNEILQCAQAMSPEGQYILLGRAHEILNKYPAAKANRAS